MGLGEVMMVAGIGCRAGASALEVNLAIDAALRAITTANARLQRLATPATKGHESGIIAAAEARGLTLVLIAQTDLEAADARTLTRSDRARATLNVNSVAEAAALAGAGPHSRLLGPRVALGPVTCALAEGTNLP
jgi:cobalt-precorrin 5A hydrolase